MGLKLLVKNFCRYLLCGMIPCALFMQPLLASDMSKEKKDLDIEISGKVIDETGDGLPGVAIVVKGSSTGTITDANGNYKITVDESATLVFSFVGYLTVEESIGGRSVIDIQLETDIKTLGEVVVTGYQELSRERVTGSFETLTGDVIMQRPTANFKDKLEGMASGVLVTEGKVTIRGQSTISANADPLYVVDGFPMTGATPTVNPEDIESITILKDAAAASIWGVRASNGVIVITTKKGNKKATKINFSTFTQVYENVDFSKQNWMTTAEEIDLQEEWFDKGWYAQMGSTIGAHSGIDQVMMAQAYKTGLAPNGVVWSDATYDAFINNLKTKDVVKDWENHLVQQSVRQTYNFSISGGGENNSIYASLVYNDNKASVVGNADDRVILNVRDEFSFRDRFIFSAGVNSSIRNYTANGFNPNTVEQVRPYDNLIDEFGRTIQHYTSKDPWISKEKEATDGYFQYSYNHLDEMRNKDVSGQRVDVRTQFGIGVNIIKGLRFDTRFQYEVGFDNKDDYRTMDLPSQKIFINNFYRPDEFDDDGEEYGYQVPIGTRYFYNKNDYHAFDWRNTISYDKTFSEHSINVFAGTEIRKHVSDNLSGTLYGYDRQTTNYIPVNERIYRSGEILGWNRNGLNTGAFGALSNKDFREVSFFSNLGYSYDDKYSITGSFRVDQKNLFGSDPKFRYKPLWSVGGSWQAAKEGFMSGFDIVNRLTLRATYGISGNASNKYSPYAQAVNTVQGWGSNIYNFLELTSPANDQLKWEETAIWNIGVDFALWNNKLSGSVEYYSKNSTDLLGERPLDPTAGFAFANINYASMTNKGVDLTLKGTVIESGDLRWNAQLLFSYNANKVTEVANELLIPAILAKDGALRVGLPLDNIWSFDYAGLNEFGDVMINTGEGVSKNWREYEGTEKEEDLIYYGTGVAPVYGGFSSTVSYKGFDLTINTSLKFGYSFKQYTGVGVAGYYYNKRMNSNWKDRWREPGDELTTRVPKMHVYGINPLKEAAGRIDSAEDWWDNYTADWYWQDSQDFVYDGGFIRVKDIILGYNLPNRLISSTPIESVRLSAQMTNPFVWLANGEGIDPETVDHSSNNTFWRGTLYRRSTAAWTGLSSATVGLRVTF